MESHRIWKYCFIVMCLAELSATRDRKPHKHSSALLRQSNPFDIDLRGTLRQQFFVNSVSERDTLNHVDSPLSALIPIGALGLGAGGPSLQELLDAVGAISQDDIEQHFNGVFSELRSLTGVELCIATKLFLAKGLKFQMYYFNNIRRIFRASTEVVNFKTPVSTLQHINTWISDNTGGRINDMVTSSDINSGTVLLIVNALYFKGQWEENFKKEGQGAFYTPSTEKRVPMMRLTTRFNYTNSSDLDSAVIQIPYLGGKANFVLVLPNRRHGLPDLLKTLNRKPQLLKSAMANLDEQFIELHMPKFKIETDIDLAKIYKEIGVNRIFRKTESGLDKMIVHKNIFVSNAKQRAFIEVYENGTTAGSASVIEDSTFVYERLRMYVDHPFLFFVMGRSQQLFSGIVKDPDN